jgi:hypothetical protein
MYIFNNLFVPVIVVNSGNRTTKTAEQAKTAIFEHLDEVSIECDQKVLMIMRVQSKNLNLQNDFFRINWNVFTTVSA